MDNLCYKPDYPMQHAHDAALTIGNSNVDFSYLTPPLLLQSDRPTLYKVPTSDHASLYLKKRHHPKHDHVSPENYCSMNSSSINSARRKATIGGVLLRNSASLPLLPQRSSSVCEGRLFSPTRIGKVEPEQIRARRWTFSSKSTSTRGLSTINSVPKQQAKVRNKGARASPALITLRRATDSRTRTTSLTFFPPPKLSHSKSGILSYLLNTVIGANDQGMSFDQSGTIAQQMVSRIGSKYSDNATAALVSEVDPANPTVTEVAVEPVVTDSVSTINFPRTRRCSTKYMTRTSIYEVIWDENDTPSSSYSTSPVPETAQTPISRNPSVAVAHLETQLSKAIALSRRMSGTLADSHQDGPTRRLSFQSRLNLSLSRLINESALRDLPRSKQSKIAKASASIMAIEGLSHQIVNDNESGTLQGDTEFFPPFHFSQTLENSRQGSRDNESVSTGIQTGSPGRPNPKFVDDETSRLNSISSRSQQSAVGEKLLPASLPVMPVSGRMCTPPDDETVPLLPASW